MGQLTCLSTRPVVEAPGREHPPRGIRQAPESLDPRDGVRDLGLVEAQPLEEGLREAGGLGGGEIGRVGRDYPRGPGAEGLGDGGEGAVLACAVQGQASLGRPLAALGLFPRSHGKNGIRLTACSARKSRPADIPSLTKGFSLIIL